MKRILAVFTLPAALAFTALVLSGCIPSLVMSSATTTGVVASQERSMGNAVDDTGIKLTIDNLYLRKDVGDLFKNVQVRSIEGRVMLTGNVDKPETKVDAVQLAWQATGVREVIDEIQVNDKTGIVDYARDGWIATQVRAKLLFEKDVRSVNYSVEAVNGVVYLMGIAQNQEELSKAAYLASITPYVKQVVSHVILKDDPRRKIYAAQQPANHSADQSPPDRPSTSNQSAPDQSSGGGQPESQHRNSNNE